MWRKYEKLKTITINLIYGKYFFFFKYVVVLLIELFCGYGIDGRLKILQLFSYNITTILYVCHDQDHYRKYHLVHLIIIYYIAPFPSLLETTKQRHSYTRTTDPRERVFAATVVFDVAKNNNGWSLVRIYTLSYIEIYNWRQSRW